MNKKFSTLAAGLLLATAFGSNAYAEELVKATPVSGKSYAIISAPLAGSVEYALAIDGDKLIPEVKGANPQLWMFEGISSGFQKITAAGKYIVAGTGTAAGTAVLSDTKPASNNIWSNYTGVISFGPNCFIINPTAQQIDLGTAGTSMSPYAWAYEATDGKVAADGGKLMLTVATNDYVYIILGGKYLYVDPSTTPVAVSLVDKDDIDWNDYSDVRNAVWKVAYDGASTQFETLADVPTKKLNASTTGFTLSATGMGFGFDAAVNYSAIKGAALRQITADSYFMGGSWKTIAQIENTQADTDATNDLFITDAPEALLYQAPEVVVAATNPSSAADLLEGHNVSNGMIIALSDDGQKFLSMKADGTLQYATATSPISDEAALWVVNIDNTNPKKPVYSFTNVKYEKHLTIANENTFHASEVPGYTLGINLYGTTTGEASGKVNLTSSISTLGVTAKAIGFYRAGRTAYSEGELNAQLGNGFDMSVFVSKKDKKSEINGTKNFTGVITAEGTDKTNDTEKNYKLYINGKLVVLSKTAAWSSSNTELMGKPSKQYRGLKFDLIDPADNNTDKYYSNFTIYKPISGDEDQIAVHVNDDLNADLYVVEVDGTYYLTVSTGINERDGETWPYVVFGSNGRVGDEILGKYYNIEYYSAKKNNVYNGKVYGLVQDDYAQDFNNWAKFVEASLVQKNKPEGQWAIRRANAAEEGAYVFANREYPEITTNGLVLYKTAQENVYAVVSGYIGNADTIRVTPVETKRFEGYYDVDAATLRDKAYTMSIANILTEVNLYEKHSENHAIALSTEEAASWRMKVDTAYIGVEVGYINAKNQYATKIDTLGVPVYTIQNLDNEEKLDVFYSNNQYYYLATDGIRPAGSEGWNQGYKFAFKEVGENYNLLPVFWWYDNDGKIQHQLYRLKVYAALSSDEVRTEGMYKKSDNDIVILRDGDAAEYKTVAMGDTVTIFRDENPAQILTESGSYLSILNDYQFEVNPAMFVDTAYVDRVENGVKNNRPQYMLVVNPERRKLDHVCNVPGHPEAHTDTLYGRFLVNLMDSAILHKEISTHKTDFLKKDNSGSTYFAKLAFVPGFHTGDSLYLMVNDKKVDTLNLATPDFNVAKFSFRYEDVEDGSFKIQTAFKPYANADKEVSDANQTNDGYLKWINDVLVVANNKNVGDVFNMETTEEAPTANEEVAAAEVSVVAVKGAIIVKGAAGKVVTVANILGQTIANQVAASDNVTIAAPAGVAVVTVDGEATKVVVK